MNAPGPVKFVTVQDGQIAFEVPSTWIEDSVVSVAAPGPAPRATLTLNRMSAAPDENLDTTVMRRLAESSPVFPLEVVSTHQTHAAGHWGMEVVVTLPTEDPADLILQRMVFLRTQDAVWVVSGSSTKKQGRAALVFMDSALATLQLPNTREGRR